MIGLTSTPVVAVILAAGMSRRMGAQNKLLLTIEGQPMVRHVVLAALASRCHKVLVVVGHEAECVRQVLCDLPVEFVLNPAFAEGIGASVRAGAQAVSRQQAVLFCLADMPGVSARVIDRLVEAFETNRGFMGFAPVFNGKRGNPVLWVPGCVSRLREAAGDEGAWGLLRQYRDRVMAVEVTSEWVMVDLDTPDDFWRVYNRRTSNPAHRLSRLS